MSKRRHNDDLRLSDDAAAWFARLGHSDLSEEDLREFEAWRCRSPAHERAWADMCALWNDPAIHAAARIAAGSVLRKRATVWRSVLGRRIMTGAVVGLV